VISEAFISGTEPTEHCSVYDHQRLRLPYTFQGFPLNDHGELVVSSGELETLLTREPSAWLIDGQRRLEFHMPTETISMPIEVVHVPEGLPTRDDPRLDAFDTSTWLGRDGRLADIVFIDGRSRR
jgi:hypothetical protein